MGRFRGCRSALTGLALRVLPTGPPPSRDAHQPTRTLGPHFVLPTPLVIGVVVPRRAGADLVVRAAPVRRAFGPVRFLDRLACLVADRDVARRAIFEFFPDVGGRAPAFGWYPELYLDVVLARELFDPSFAVADDRLGGAQSPRRLFVAEVLNSGFSNSSYGVGVRPFCGSRSSSCAIPTSSPRRCRWCASSRLLCRWFTRPSSAMTTPLIIRRSPRRASSPRRALRPASRPPTRPGACEVRPASGPARPSSAIPSEARCRSPASASGCPLAPRR